MKDEELYKKAERRVDEIKGFHSHLIVFIVVNIFLFLLNYLTSPGDWWFYWPLLGWGIGFSMHAFHTFGHNLILGRN